MDHLLLIIIITAQTKDLVDITAITIIITPLNNINHPNIKAIWMKITIEQE